SSGSFVRARRWPPNRDQELQPTDLACCRNASSSAIRWCRLRGKWSPCWCFRSRCARTSAWPPSGYVRGKRAEAWTVRYLCRAYRLDNSNPTRDSKFRRIPEPATLRDKKARRHGELPGATEPLLRGRSFMGLGRIAPRRLARRRTAAGFLYHLFNLLVELGPIHHLDERLPTDRIADDVDSGSVVERNALPQLIVSLDFGGQVPVRIHHEWHCDFVLLSKSLGHAAKILLGNLQLVLKDVKAIVVTHLRRFGVEEASIHRRLKRPGVHGQRKIMLHQRDVVLLGRLVQQRRCART